MLSIIAQLGTLCWKNLEQSPDETLKIRASGAIKKNSTIFGPLLIIDAVASFSLLSIAILVYYRPDLIKLDSSIAYRFRDIGLLELFATCLGILACHLTSEKKEPTKPLDLDPKPLAIGTGNQVQGKRVEVL